MTLETIPAEETVATEGPTRVRWGVLFCLATLALLLYVDRVCIGQAAEPICRELGLSKDDFSWVFMAFTLAYCLFEVPTGHWGDRFGSRGVITRVVVWWSIFTALTGATLGLYSLILVRFLFGAGEAGAYPNVAIVIAKWFPLRDQGKARGVVTTVSLLGGAAAPIIAAYLIDWIGWRWTFSVFGAFGIVWAAAFYWWFVDSPADHPQCNAAEVKLISKGKTPKAAHDAHAAIPWRIVLTSPNTWFLGTIMICSASLFYTQFQWGPTYIKEVWFAVPNAQTMSADDLDQAHRDAQKWAGFLTSGMMIGGATGCLSGGLLVDALVRRTSNRRLCRRLVGGGALLMSALSMLAVPFADSAILAMLCNASAGFFTQLAVPTWWTAVSEISGKHGAAMWGLMNSMGGLGVIVTTKLEGWYVDKQEQLKVAPIDCWNPVFTGIGLMLIVGSILWLLVDTNRSIVERPPT